MKRGLIFSSGLRPWRRAVRRPKSWFLQRHHGPPGGAGPDGSQSSGGKLYRAVFRDLPDALFVMDEQTTLLAVNPAALHLFGYRESELAGKRLLDLASPEQHAQILRLIDEVRGAGFSQCEAEGVRRDGGTFNAMVNGARISFGGRPCYLVVAREVTENKLADHALRESEERLRLLADNLPNAMVYQIVALPDGSRHFTYVGRNVERLNEVSAADVLADPDKLYSQIVPEGLPDFLAAEEEALRDMGTFHHEIECRLPSGRRRWFDLASTPRKLPDGGILWDGVQVDITERKQAEERMRRSEDRFRSSFHNAPVGMATLDSRGCFLDVNAQVCKILGYTPDEMIGKPFNGFTHPEDRAGGIERWRELLNHEAEVNQAEKRYLHKNGRVVWVIVSNTLFRDEAGKPLFFLSHMVDISDRKNAEEALRNEQGRLHAILQANPDPVVVYDNQGIIQFLNPAFAKVFGWTLDEVKDRCIPFVPDEYAHPTMGLIRKLFETGKSVTVETKRLTKGGKVLDVFLSAAAVRDSAGDCIGMVVDLQDITERKALEAKLLQAQKMEALGTLAGGIAHDFNNILQAIAGYTQLLQVDANDGERRKDRLDRIGRAVDRAAELIRRLMTLGRKVEARQERVDLNGEIGQTVQILEHTLPRMISLRTELDPRLRAVEGDPGQIGQILLNLANNAWQAMPQGGQLTFSTCNRLLSETDCKSLPGLVPGPYAQLTVTDTGVGMDEATMSHVFEPFFTTKPLGQGTGLGLSTVYGTIANHRGLIQCQSLPNQGTTFTVYLPAKVEEGSESAGEAGSLAPSLAGGETVLVVDDEPAILEICREALESFGYRVICADSGEDALEIYRSDPRAVDLVIMDLSMPGMGGRKCLAEMLAIRPEAKALVATGYASETVMRELGGLGAVSVIGKPYRISDLALRVRGLLES